MLYRCPYEDGHVYVCNKVGWLAHPVPGHGKKSCYATEFKVIKYGGLAKGQFSWLIDHPIDQVIQLC